MSTMKDHHSTGASASGLIPCPVAVAQHCYLLGHLLVDKIQAATGVSLQIPDDSFHAHLIPHSRMCHASGQEVCSKCNVRPILRQVIQSGGTHSVRGCIEILHIHLVFLALLCCCHRSETPLQYTKPQSSSKTSRCLESSSQ